MFKSLAYEAMLFAREKHKDQVRDMAYEVCKNENREMSKMLEESME